MHAALQDMRYLGQVRYVHWQESKIAVPEAGVDSAHFCQASLVLSTCTGESGRALISDMTWEREWGTLLHRCTGK